MAALIGVNIYHQLNLRIVNKMTDSLYLILNVVAALLINVVITLKYIRCNYCLSGRKIFSYSITISFLWWVVITLIWALT